MLCNTLRAFSPVCACCCLPTHVEFTYGMCSCGCSLHACVGSDHHLAFHVTPAGTQQQHLAAQQMTAYHAVGFGLPPVASTGSCIDTLAQMQQWQAAAVGYGLQSVSAGLRGSGPAAAPPAYMPYSMLAAAAAAAATGASQGQDATANLSGIHGLRQQQGAGVPPHNLGGYPSTLGSSGAPPQQDNNANPRNTSSSRSKAQLIGAFSPPRVPHNSSTAGRPADRDRPEGQDKEGRGVANSQAGSLGGKQVSRASSTESTQHCTACHCICLVGETAVLLGRLWHAALAYMLVGSVARSAACKLFV